jgi:hypothetical protein
MSEPNFAPANEAFGDAMIHALGEPLARARAGSRVLADQLRGAHAPAVQSIVDALERSESALRDLVEFVRAGEMRVVRRRADLRPVCERVIDSVERRLRPLHAIELSAERRVIGDWDTDAVAGILTRLLTVALEGGPAENEGCESAGVRLRTLETSVVVEVWTTRRPYVRPADDVFEAPDAGASARAVTLHLASLAARAHEGRIEVAHDPRGMVYRVALPRYVSAVEGVFTNFDRTGTSDL